MNKKIIYIIVALVIAALILGFFLIQNKSQENGAAQADEKSVSPEDTHKTEQENKPEDKTFLPDETENDTKSEDSAKPENTAMPENSPKPENAAKPEDSANPEKTPEPEDIVNPEEIPNMPEDTSEPIIIEPKPATYSEYEKYNSMSGEEQKAFINSFDDVDDFFAWYEKAKADYENNSNKTVLDGTTNIEFG